MSLSTAGGLTPVPAAARPDLVAEPVRSALASWQRAPEVEVVEIDPALADTAALTRAYSVPMTMSANCVVVSGRRHGDEHIAACVVRADMRVDVNTVVKRLLDVRKATFLSVERAVQESGMEYGGITPVGIPPFWRLLIAAEVTEIPVVMIGSGVRRSKLLLPGARLSDLPNAQVVDHLGVQLTDAPSAATVTVTVTTIGGAH